MSFTWDPGTYLRYADERARPFFELLARVRHDHPRTIVDLGCGPGNLTDTLPERWPQTRVLGVDSSAEMIADARSRSSRTEYAVADAATFEPPEDTDVVVANALWQWVPDHLNVLRRLRDALPHGGVLAWQVPGNFGQPSHTLREELAAEPPYAEHLVGVPSPQAFDAETYYRELAGAGFSVDAWETTYVHVLHGADAVFDWVSGTGARPTLAALPQDLRDSFTAEFKARLRTAYPQTRQGVLLPFRRIFAVGQKR